MLTLSPDKLLPLILGASLLLVASINVYTLLHLLRRVDGGQRDTAIPGAPGSAMPDAEADDSWLDGMGRLFGLVEPVGLSEAGAVMDQSLEILDGLGAVRDEDLSTWRATHQQRIGSLLADHRQQRQKLLQMHDALVQARATISTLRGQAPRSAIIAAQLTALKALNARQEEAICQLTSDRTQYQWELRAAEQRHESRIEAEVTSRQALERTHALLLRELEALRDSSAVLEKSNAELRATHERVMREKLFIEEAFIKLDECTSTPAPAALPGDAAPPPVLDKEAT